MPAAPAGRQSRVRGRTASFDPHLHAARVAARSRAVEGLQLDEIGSGLRDREAARAGGGGARGQFGGVGIIRDGTGRRLARKFLAGLLLAGDQKVIDRVLQWLVWIPVLGEPADGQRLSVTSASGGARRWLCWSG